MGYKASLESAAGIALVFDLQSQVDEDILGG
jgi:hypothetical protein